GSVATVVLVGLAGLSWVLGGDPSWWLPLVGAAALVGFLVWNLPPARLYLGDGGAYVVGVTIAWSVLRAADDWPTALVAVALVGVPFLDLGVAILGRLVARAPVFAGDRSHTYDRLHARGWPVGRVAA